jgi:exopolyphosphatase/guanosine-5'-triphosphate,3'-diphosphate pyrophosphatase
VIAAVARYHTRATPSPSHPEYAALSKPRQTLVNVLSAILRIADALDREHTSDVKSVIVHCDDKQVLLLPQYAGDLLLPEWALRSKKRWFEEVFSRPLVLGSQADMGVPKGE